MMTGWACGARGGPLERCPACNVPMCVACERMADHLVAVHGWDKAEVRRYLAPPPRVWGRGDDGHILGDTGPPNTGWD
jgi:hypothetical protein